MKPFVYAERERNFNILNCLLQTEMCLYASLQRKILFRETMNTVKFINRMSVLFSIRSETFALLTAVRVHCTPDTDKSHTSGIHAE